jgi:hypothetical protein
MEDRKMNRTGSLLYLSVSHFSVAFSLRASSCGFVEEKTLPLDLRKREADASPANQATF